MQPILYGGSAVSAYRALVISDGPVAYWPMNDSAPTSGNGTFVDVMPAPANANVTGANVLFRQTGTYLPLPTGLPAYFPSNQYASVSDTGSIPKFVFSPSQTMTVEAWVSLNPRIGGVAGGDIFSMNTNQGFRLGTDNGNTSGFAAVYVVYSNSLQYIVRVPLYSYLHVVVTVGPGGSVCYINGVPSDFIPAAWSGTDGTYVSLAGQYNTAFSEYLTGWLSNVAVYNYALTEAQVLNHFRVGGGFNYNQLLLADGAVVSYPMGNTAFSNAQMVDVVGTWSTSGQEIFTTTNGTFNEPFTVVGKSATYTQEPFYGALSGSLGLAGLPNSYAEAGFTLNFPPQTFTQEVWVATTYPCVISSFNGAQNATGGPSVNPYFDRCMLIGANGQLGWGNFDAAVPTAVALFGGPVVNDGGPHHLVYTQQQNPDGSVNMTLYVDGSQVAQALNQPASQTYPNNQYYLSIGYGPEGSQNPPWFPTNFNVNSYFHGSLSNFSFYLQCLTPSQVHNHYLAGVTTSAQQGGSTVLNLQFNGNFTDGAGHIPSFVGTPTTTFAGPPGQVQTSGVFSAGNFVSYAPAADLVLGSAFDIDCWVYFTTLPSSSQFATIFYQGTNTTSSQPKGLHIYLDGGLYNPAGHLVASNLTANYLSYNWQPSTNTWYHIQLQRSGAVLALLIDGVCVDVNTNTTDTLALDNCWVGGHPAYPAVGALTGYLNNFTITNSVVAAGDPYWSNVTALFQFEGTAGAQTFYDNSNLQLTGAAGTGGFTASAGAVLSGSQFKFGSSSLAFSGTQNQFVSISSNTGFVVMGSSDFTIEMFFYIAADSVNDAGGKRAYLLVERNNFNAGNDNLFIILLDGGTGTTGGGGLAAGTGGGQSSGPNTTAVSSVSTAAISQGAWHHVALVRYGNTLTTYVDGVAGVPADCTGISFGDGGYTVQLGGVNNAPYDAPLNGYIDEFRVTKGVARYTGTFTPPTQPFPTF